MCHGGHGCRNPSNPAAIIRVVAGTLYLVGTPIGNLEDLSDRARRTLGAVDLVAAEDTRRTGLMLKALGIRARLVSFFEGNEAERVPKLVEVLHEGKDVALVSDAGMPALSDPGYRLVAACVEAGIPVDVVPGPSAAVAALVVSGLPTDRFVFDGFLPRSGKARRQRILALAKEPRTVVLFESPRRVGATLADLLAACGDRRVAVLRELTKRHQEALRGHLSDVLQELRGRELKGEVAVVLEGSPGDTPDTEVERAVGLAADLEASGLRKREAARRAAELTGVPARRIYQGLVGGTSGTPSSSPHGATASNRAPRGRRAKSSE
jgi:16S rRNA (cytidine1402-2'-O)-methyltransferase